MTNDPEKNSGDLTPPATSQRSGSQDLAAREAWYRAVIETSADGFWVCDRQGRILEVNDAYVKRSGYSREEILAMRIHELEAAERRRETTKHIDKIIREGSDIFETLHRARDGTVWPVEINSSYSPMDGGLFFVHLRDIGLRKRAAVLLAARDRLSCLSETVELDVLMQSALDEAELLTGSRIGFFHLVDDDQEHLTLTAWSTNTLKTMCTAVGKGTHYPVSKAGVWVDCFRARKAVIHDDYGALPDRKGLPEGHARVTRELALPVLRGGKVKAIIGVGNKTRSYTAADVEGVSELASHVIDLVEEKRAKEALQLNERRLRLAMEASKQGWFELDIQTGEVGVSDEYAWILGYAPGEFTSNLEDWFDNIHPEDVDALKRVYSECLKSGRKCTLDYRRRGKSGEWKWIRSVGKVVEHDAEGRPLRMTGTHADISELKQSEEELRAQASRFEAVFSLGPDPATITDITTGAIIDLNDAAARWFGLSRSEAIGKTTADVQVWEDPSDRDRMLSEMKERGKVDDMSFRLRNSAGEIREVLFSARPLELDGKQALLSRAHDVTPLKCAEEALQDSERKYRELVENANSIIVIWDSEGRVTFFNSFAKRFFGFTEQQIVGKHVVGTIVPETESVSGRDLGRLMNEICQDPERFQDIENENITRDGRRVWVRWRNRAILDAEGKPVGVLSLGIDETARKVTEKALQDSRALYQDLVETAQDLIWQCDKVGRYVFLNQAWERVFGYRIEEMLGRKFSDFQDRDVAERDVDTFARLLQGGPVIGYQTMHRARDGHPVYLVFNAKLYHDEFGNVAGTRGSAHDITGRKQAEEALQRERDLLQAVMDGTRNAHLVYLDRDFNFVRVNEAYATTCGYRPEAMIGKNHFELYPHAENEVMFARVRNTGEPVEVRDKPFVFPDQPERGITYWDWTLTPVKDETGYVTGLVFSLYETTAHKKAEEALRNNESLLRQSQAVAQLGHYVFNIAADTWTSSEGLDKVFGIGPAHPRTSSGWLDIVHPDDRQFMEHHLVNHVLRDGNPFDREYRIIRVSDGAERWVHGLGTLDLDASGNPVRMFGTIQDVTDRRTMEEALRQSEARLNTVLDHVDAYVFMKDTNYRYTYANRKVCELFGVPEHALVGKGDDAFFTRDSLADILASDQSVIRDGVGVAREEAGLATPAGPPRTYWTVKVPMRDTSGQITGLCGISTDITDRKQAEEALRRNEQFIRGIHDSVDEGLIVVDREYRILSTNKAFCELTGREIDDIIGKSCYEVSHHASMPCVKAGEDCAVKQVFETGEPKTVMHRHQDGSRNTIYIEIRAFPLKNAAGEVTGAIEVLHNVTERHLLEAEQLKTQKLEAIGTLAGGIAHDFNNLLQGVFGYVSIAKLSAKDPAKTVQMLDEAENALSLSVNLTNQLLTFAKGGQPVKKRVETGRVVESATKFALSGSRCNHALKLPPDLWAAEVDEGQISQVIQNIALNASEAMPAGGTVEVSAENLELAEGSHPSFPEGGRFIRMTVRDSGIGIPEAYLSRIFDPYFTTKQKGSGLGLATSYSIVKNHGGTIEVKSEQNVGTTFLIIIPASEFPTEEHRPEESPQGGPGSKARVLLMDDEERVRTVGRDMIEALGHDVVLAAHGTEAITKYREALAAGTPFDLVILDLTVKGGMGGEEALRHLKNLAPDVKAVVSSGYSDDPIVSDYTAHGFSSMLNKPYSINELRTCLNALMQQTGSGPARGGSGPKP